MGTCGELFDPENSVEESRTGDRCSQAPDWRRAGPKDRKVEVEVCLGTGWAGKTLVGFGAVIHLSNVN